MVGGAMSWGEESIENNPNLLPNPDPSLDPTPTLALALVQTLANPKNQSSNLLSNPGRGAMGGAKNQSASLLFVG